VSVLEDAVRQLARVVAAKWLQDRRGQCIACGKRAGVYSAEIEASGSAGSDPGPFCSVTCVLALYGLVTQEAVRLEPYSDHDEALRMEAVARGEV